MLENKMLIDSYWHDEWYWIDCNNHDPELIEDILSIDDDIDDLEEEFGSMDKVDEFTLADIVKEKTGLDAESVFWDEMLDAIVYTYYEEAA